jgi:peptidyl-prolyl cis-trans isomerase C
MAPPIAPRGGGCGSGCGCASTRERETHTEHTTLASAIADSDLTPVAVDGVAIPEQAIARELQYHPARSFGRARAEAVRALVVRQLLLNEAARRGLLDAATVARPLPEAARQRAIDSLVSAAAPVPSVTEAEIRAFFAAHRDRFASPPLQSASHILLAAPPDDTEARAHARRDAEATRAVLREHPDRFEKLAKQRSACPSAREGGTLGQLSPGDLVPEVERALSAMQVGEILDHPVESEHGFHILRLDARAPGRPLPFEAVRSRIETYLRDQAWRRRVHDWVAELATQATITGCELR